MGHCKPSKSSVFQGSNKLSESNLINLVGLLALEDLEQHVLDVDEGGHLGLVEHDGILVLTAIIHVIWRPVVIDVISALDTYKS